MADADFKRAVKAYIELHDELQAASKGLRDLRKKKKELSEAIVQFMRENDIDECALNDGKLIRKQSKRLEPLKKEHILGELQKFVGDDSQRAEAALVSIFARRGVELTDTLRRTRKRGGAPAVGATVAAVDAGGGGATA